MSNSSASKPGGDTAALNLAVVQRWMQAVITHPLGIDQGVRSPGAQSEIALDPDRLDTVVNPSQSQTSSERMAVYSNAYFARLLECMRELFPALVDTLGEEVFDSFSFGYLQEYPSTSYTLEHLANRFVQYLEKTRPALDDLAQEDSDDEPSAVDSSWPDFVIDLARLEWTIDLVFDGPGVEHEQTLTAEQIQAIPADQWGYARFVMVPCLRLLAFSYPVNAFYTEYRQETEPPFPDPEPTFAAITRRDYIVRRFELSPEQYKMLSALAAGCTLVEAIESVADSFSDMNALADSLKNWFSQWSANAFFLSVEIEADA